MSHRLSIGVALRPGPGGEVAEIVEQARYAEELGFDAVFIGDHLRPAAPYPESLITLAAAAGATERIDLGVGVMVLALRHPVWAAKQIGTLQSVSGGRLVLGVGSGGKVHGTEAWEAVGVPFADRGRRTDEALDLLPPLLRGERVGLPSGAEIELSPPAAVPPILIGGNSAAARRRAIRHGAGWFPSMLLAERLEEGVGELPDGTPIAIRAAALLGADASDRRIAGYAASLVGAYGVPAEDARRIPISGSPDDAAERLATYADAGAARVVLGSIDDDWRGQWERIAVAVSRLPWR